MTPSAPDLIPPRPFFVQPGVNRDQLPESVQAALEAIVDPAYFELVLCPNNALERAAGVSLVFLLFAEILEQCELGELIIESGAGAPGDPAAREKAFAQHLRLVSCKQTAISSLLRVRTLSKKAWTIPDDSHSA